MDKDLTKQYNLELAVKVGKIEECVLNMNEKIDFLIHSNEKKDDKIWDKIDSHANKIEKHNSLIKWIIGIGSGITTSIGVFLSSFK